MTESSRVHKVPEAEMTESSRVPRVPKAEMTESSRVPRVLKAEMTGTRRYWYYDDLCKYPCTDQVWYVSEYLEVYACGSSYLVPGIVV